MKQWPKKEAGAMLPKNITDHSVTLPGEMNSTSENLFLSHFWAYRYAKSFASGKMVLDVGCGSGYGMHDISSETLDALGTDLSLKELCGCRQRYGKTTSFLCSDAVKLPFKDSCLDLVVSFQVIEHIHPSQVVAYLCEIKRVLRPGGLFMVTTPNRLLRLLPFQKPWNPDHKKEYDANELRNLLAEVFSDVEILGLSASKDAYLIEYNRVKQSPLRVYLVDPIIAMILYVLPQSLIAKLKNASIVKENLPLECHPTAVNCRLSLSNFRLSSKNLISSIDLYGICRKSAH